MALRLFSGSHLRDDRAQFAPESFRQPKLSYSCAQSSVSGSQRTSFRLRDATLYRGHYRACSNHLGSASQRHVLRSRKRIDVMLF